MEGDHQGKQAANFMKQIIIILVKQRPALYDPNVRQRAIKKALWQEISNEFEGLISTDTLKKKWNYLRATYMTAKKNGNLERMKMIFPFYSEMSFLDDIPEKITSKTANKLSSNSPAVLISQGASCSTPPALQEKLILNRANKRSGLSLDAKTSRNIRATVKTSAPKMRKAEELNKNTLTSVQQMPGIDVSSMQLVESLRRVPHEIRSELLTEILKF